MVHKQEECGPSPKWRHWETTEVFRVTLTELTCHLSFTDNTDLVCNNCPEIPSKEGNCSPFFLM